MTKTTKETIYRAMRITGYLEEGAAPSGDSYEDALASFNALVVWIDDNLNFQWTDDAIEDDHFAYVAGMLAGRLTDVFPLPEKGKQRALSAAANGERALRQITARKPRKAVQVPLV